MPGDSGRAGSLRLTNRPIHIPIPPSLVQSPYLLSPQSVFPHAGSTSLPSSEDEEWLQDTIPLSLERRDGDGKRAGPVLTSSNDEKRPTRQSGTSSELRMPSIATPSPSLVRRRISPPCQNKDVLHEPPVPHDYNGTI